MRFEMKCDDANEAMSAGLDGELGDAERPRLRHHLAGCDRCRARDAEMRAVHRQMRSALRVSQGQGASGRPSACACASSATARRPCPGSRRSPSASR